MNYGETLARSVADRIYAAVLTVAALAAIPAEERVDGMRAVVTADNSLWVFSSASAAVDTTSQLVVAPSAGTGAWLRADKYVDLKLAIAFGTADAAVLLTVPTGFKLNILRAFWEATADFTGGASSTIGVSSSNAGYNTKGDILGGAAGSALAALTAGYRPGTIGTKFGSNGVVILVAGDTVRHDRITSAFTAGAGFVHLAAQLIG